MLEPERVPPVAPSVEFDKNSPAWAKFAGRVMWWPQKIIYAPAILLVLILVGLVISALRSANRQWILLLSVPIYALFIQSMLHTEPRYTVGIWYFLLIFAGVGGAGMMEMISKLSNTRSKLVSNCF
jgi:peptidoglycan/LPS O-acetylase OafA/YrhL